MSTPNVPVFRVPALAKPSGSSLTSIASYLGALHRSLTLALVKLADAIRAEQDKGTVYPAPLPSFTVAGLAAITTPLTIGDLAFCTDAAVTTIPVFWDGASWRRFDTGITVA